MKQRKLEKFLNFDFKKKMKINIVYYNLLSWADYMTCTYEFTYPSTWDLNYRMFICTTDQYMNCFYKTINVSMYQGLHTAATQDLFVFCTYI